MASPESSSQNWETWVNWGAVEAANAPEANPPAVPDPEPGANPPAVPDPELLLEQRRRELHNAVPQFLGAFMRNRPALNLISSVQHRLQIDTSTMTRLNHMEDAMSVCLGMRHNVRGASQAAKLLEAAMKEWDRDHP